MPFSFFQPWLWLAAIGVAAPIWLHLRRRMEKNRVQFSALRFLDDLPEPRRSPLQLRDVLLFAVRALAVLLLAGAFAWPFVRRAGALPVRESRVYILDNTLSHQAGNGFAQDRERMAREIGRAGNDVQVAVVELTAVPRVVAGFGDSREILLDRVRQLQPSFQRGSYLAAFRQANSLLANSLGLRKRIIFLGDNQANQWSENVNSPPFLRSIQVENPSASRPALPNLSLSEPRLERVFLGDKSRVNFTVKLTHQGGARSAEVVLRTNGQVVFRRTVPLEKQPETILLQTQWEADPAQWVRGDATVEGAPDALAADNRVFFSLPPVVEGTVALLAQSPYLRLALSPDIMRGHWAARVLDPAKIGAELAAGKDADVLCLESSYLQSSEARKLLGRYLSSGRGVFLVVNRLTPVINGYLRELGFESEGTARTGEGSPEKFRFVFSNHPIFHPFASTDYGSLMDIRVSEYARLKAKEGLPLIFGEHGEGLFFQGTKTPGKLFVAAFGMDREQSSWPIHPSFIPFLDLTLQAARAGGTAPASFEPGEMAMIQLGRSSAAREVVLRDGEHEIRRAAVERGRARLLMPGKPGVYALTCDDRKAIEQFVAVNPSPKESQLVFSNSAAVMKSWTMPAGAEPARLAWGQARLSDVLQQRLWWWMVLGGLLALMAEMTLAEVRKAGT